MLRALVLSSLAAALTAQGPPSTPLTERWRTRAEALAERGKTKDALAAVTRAVEGDSRDLKSLRLLASLAVATDDKDLAVFTLHRWRDVQRTMRGVPSRFSQDVEKELTRLDPDYRTFDNLSASYLRWLAGTAKTHTKKEPALALAVQRDILRLDADNVAATRAIATLAATQPAAATPVPSLVKLDAERRLRPDDRDTRVRRAKLLEDLGDRDGAADAYRNILRQLIVTGEVDSPTWTQTLGRWQALDRGSEQYGKARSTFLDGGLELARKYEADGMPRMALRVALAVSDALGAPEAFRYAHDLAKRTQRPPLPWRVAYDETSLQGWKAAPTYRAADETLVAELAGDLEAARATGVHVPLAADEPPATSFPTTQLLLEAPPTGDFSFEAEMRIAADGRGAFAGARMGLCFGVKDAANQQAVLLRPQDVLDVATCRANEWTAGLHRPWMVGNHWIRVRIDVIGAHVDLYLDDALVHAYDLPSPDSAAGGLGLISGSGKTLYRNVRVLARTDDDSAMTLERALARSKRASGNGALRTESILGIEPPLLQPRLWIQGEPVRLGDLRGKPVLLAFWSVEQDRVIPCTRLFNDIVARGKDKGLALVVFCDGGSTKEGVRSYLESRPMPTAHIAADDGNLTLGAFGVRGLPFLVLLDAEGKIVFQGSADLERTNGWSGGSTPLDGPLRELLGK